MVVIEVFGCKEGLPCYKQISHGKCGYCDGRESLRTLTHEQY